MQRKVWKWIVPGMLCLMMVPAVGMAWQRAPEGGRGGALASMCRAGKAGRDGGAHAYGWMRMLQRLDLDEAQQKQVAGILDEQRRQDQKLHDKLRDVRRDMRKVMDPKTFDEKQLRKLASQKATLQADLMVGMARTRQRIYNLLNAEQKELFDFAVKLRRMDGNCPMGPERGMRRRPPMPFADEKVAE
jgi:Spy/CpxP family protein refolding chaperone